MSCWSYRDSRDPGKLQRGHWAQLGGCVEVTGAHLHPIPDWEQNPFKQQGSSFVSLRATILICLWVKCKCQPSWRNSRRVKTGSAFLGYSLNLEFWLSYCPQCEKSLSGTLHFSQCSIFATKMYQLLKKKGKGNENGCDVLHYLPGKIPQVKYVEDSLLYGSQ